VSGLGGSEKRLSRIKVKGVVTKDEIGSANKSYIQLPKVGNNVCNGILIKIK
jgi:hypothetical protein